MMDSVAGLLAGPTRQRVVWKVAYNTNEPKNGVASNILAAAACWAYALYHIA